MESTDYENTSENQETTPSTVSNNQVSETNETIAMETIPKRGPGRPRKYPAKAPSPSLPRTAYTPQVSSQPYYDPKIEKYMMKQKVKKYVQHYLDKYSQRVYSGRGHAQPVQYYDDPQTHHEYEYDDDAGEEYDDNKENESTRIPHSASSSAHQHPSMNASAPTTNSKLDQILGRNRRR